jgi:L-asparaginase II
MTGAVAMAELWRGALVESRHSGHAAICDSDGEIIAAWGDAETVIYPRSSCKMIQALPLVESGAGAGLSDTQLALACASHQGAAIHTRTVARWLADLGLAETDLRCGAHEPADRAARDALIRAGVQPGQIHNNCSGKHCGFLMLSHHLGGGPEYIDPDHPVQRAVRTVFEELTGQPSPCHAIDGCSAPNFATTVAGLARAMAFFAAARPDGDTRSRAAARLVRAMTAHPEMVSGEGGACTELMRAMEGRVAVKTGAEGVFVAIVPERRIGIAVKIADGAKRAAETAIAALMVDLGVLDRAHSAVGRYLDAPQHNWRGLTTGRLSPAPGFP